MSYEAKKGRKLLQFFFLHTKCFPFKGQKNVKLPGRPEVQRLLFTSGFATDFSGVKIFT